MIYTTDIVFKFKDERIEDIIITEYIFGIATYNIFYFPENPSIPYIVSNLINKR